MLRLDFERPWMSAMTIIGLSSCLRHKRNPVTRSAHAASGRAPKAGLCGAVRVAAHGKGLRRQRPTQAESSLKKLWSWCLYFWLISRMARPLRMWFSPFYVFLVY